MCKEQFGNKLQKKGKGMGRKLWCGHKLALVEDIPKFTMPALFTVSLRGTSKRSIAAAYTSSSWKQKPSFQSVSDAENE